MLGWSRCFAVSARDHDSELLWGSDLNESIESAVATGEVARFVVFGSFVTTKRDPADVDVFLLMENTFDMAQLPGEARVLFDHASAQAHFGASVFWVRRLAALGGEEQTIAGWQVKRDGKFRGIVEIVEEQI